MVTASSMPWTDRINQVLTSEWWFADFWLEHLPNTDKPTYSLTALPTHQGSQGRRGGPVKRSVRLPVTDADPWSHIAPTGSAGFVKFEPHCVIARDVVLRQTSFSPSGILNPASVGYSLHKPFPLPEGLIGRYFVTYR